MLGSAIPRRWVTSLALVGLVTIFAASYSAGWTGIARADSEGPVSGSTGNSVSKTPAEILDTAEKLPSGIRIAPGSQSQFTVNLIDANGDANDSLSDLTFLWTAGGSVSIVAGNTAQTVVVQAGTAGTGTLSVQVVQVQETREWEVIRDMTITVVAPSATSTAAPAPTNPGPVPSSIPNSQGVVAPESAIMVSSSGVESGNTPESSAFKTKPVVYVRKGSVNNFYGLQVNSVNPSGLPALPAGFNRGSSAADITFVDTSGVAQSNFRLLKSAQVCLPTTSSDLVNGFANLKVLRYNSSVNQWVPLTSTYNAITNQVCASSSNFSTFAIGVQQIPTSGEGSNLPATGGWSPTNSLLVLIGLFGAALVGGGAITMRRARNAARPE